MKTIKIRDLRGAKLEEMARTGELIGLTRDRALIAVVIPMVQGWVEHLIDENWSRLQQTAMAAEAAVGGEAELVTLDLALNEAATSPHAAPPPSRSVGTVAQHVASGVTTEVLKATSALCLVGAPAVELIKRLSTALGLAEEREPSVTAISNVGIRDLSADRIERAGADGEFLVLTNNRLVIGMVIPVSQHLVEYLVSQNLSRVMYNIHTAEQAASRDAELVTLDDALDSMRSKSESRVGGNAQGGLESNEATHG